MNSLFKVAGVTCQESEHKSIDCEAVNLTITPFTVVPISP